MYYEYFGLSRAPFKITPDTDFFFSGGNRGAILDALVYAVTQGEGMVKVTGEVGSGKTMLCRMLQSRLPPHVESVYLPNPSVSPEEILHAIGFEIGLRTARGASRIELMHELHDYLVKRHAEGRQVVLFVEESQGMPIATLEEIRLLSNLETQHHKLLQIVLFGQPELDQTLSQPNIRQLRERITHSFALQPLGPDEIREYLGFRLRAADYRGPDLFAPKVVKYIADTTGGLSRRVNLVADKALLAAFADNTHTVSLAHVQAAVRDSEFSVGRKVGATASGLRWMPGLALLAVGVAIGGGLFWAFGASKPTATPLVSPTAPADASAASAPVASGTPAPAELPRSPEGARAPLTTPPTQSVAVAAAAQTEAAPATPAISPDLKAGVPVPDAGRPTPMGDLLEARLAATEAWLAKESGTAYSIQISFAPDAPEEVSRYLNYLGKFIDGNELYVYRTRVKDRHFVAVLYGHYQNRHLAQQALDRLPEQLRTYRPYLRVVETIRSARADAVKAGS